MEGVTLILQFQEPLNVVGQSSIIKGADIYVNNVAVDSTDATGKRTLASVVMNSEIAVEGGIIGATGLNFTGKFVTTYETIETFVTPISTAYYYTQDPALASAKNTDTVNTSDNAILNIKKQSLQIAKAAEALAGAATTNQTAAYSALFRAMANKAKGKFDSTDSNGLDTTDMLSSDIIKTALSVNDTQAAQLTKVASVVSTVFGGIDSADLNGAKYAAASAYAATIANQASSLKDTSDDALNTIATSAAALVNNITAQIIASTGTDTSERVNLDLTNYNISLDTTEAPSSGIIFTPQATVTKVALNSPTAAIAVDSDGELETGLMTYGLDPQAKLYIALDSFESGQTTMSLALELTKGDSELKIIANDVAKITANSSNKVTAASVNTGASIDYSINYKGIVFTPNTLTYDGTWMNSLITLDTIDSHSDALRVNIGQIIENADTAVGTVSVDSLENGIYDVKILVDGVELGRGAKVWNNTTITIGNKSLTGSKVTGTVNLH